MSEVIFGTLQKPSNYFVGRRVAIRNFSQMVTIKGEDLTEWICQNNRGVRRDHELDVVVLSQQVVQKKQEAELTLW